MEQKHKPFQSRMECKHVWTTWRSLHCSLMSQLVANQRSVSKCSGRSFISGKFTEPVCESKRFMMQLWSLLHFVGMALLMSGDWIPVEWVANYIQWLHLVQTGEPHCYKCRLRVSLQTGIIPLVNEKQRIFPDKDCSLEFETHLEKASMINKALTLWWIVRPGDDRQW